jgi:hypothetical protein
MHNLLAMTQSIVGLDADSRGLGVSPPPVATVRPGGVGGDPATAEDTEDDDDDDEEDDNDAEQDGEDQTDAQARAGTEDADGVALTTGDAPVRLRAGEGCVARAWAEPIPPP